MHAQYNEQPADSLFYNKNGFPGYSGKSISQTRSSEEKSFLQVHNNDWTKVWSSYNAGWKYDSNEAKRYSKDIALIIRELKKVNV